MKQKRKYTHKDVQSKSSPIKQESSINLPPEILEAIELTCKRRKALGLYDDSKERIERAIGYQEFLTKRQV